MFEQGTYMQGTLSLNGHGGVMSEPQEEFSCVPGESFVLKDIQEGLSRVPTLIVQRENSLVSLVKKLLIWDTKYVLILVFLMLFYLDYSLTQNTFDLKK